MWTRILTLCTVLCLGVAESFPDTMRAMRPNSSYSDFFFNTTYKGQPVTWMMMPDDTGVVVSAIISGVSPKQRISPFDIEFWLWNQETGKTPKVIHFSDDDSFLGSTEDFNPAETTTIMLIHGFTNTFVKSPFLMEAAEAYLKQGKYNVIGVNWAKLAAIPWYNMAVRNSAYVGCLTAKFINALRALEPPGSPIKLHIVSHNVGTLVAGSIENCLKGRKIERMTGLDPPEILTSFLPKDKKLDKDDAELVEVLHTSGSYIGINQAIGHRDFYANDGMWPQPGCLYDIADRCSVLRAYEYYIEAINDNESFKGVQCKNEVAYEMGLCRENPTLYLINDEAPTVTGRYYFSTNDKPPFGRY